MPVHNDFFNTIVKFEVIFLDNSETFINFISNMPSGITYNRTATGKPTSVTISLKKHGAAIEDLLDNAEIDKHRSEPTEPLEKVLARLDKKHGIRRSK